MAQYRSKSKAKKVPIKYTSRDFSSIRDDLIDYAKRYYPSTYQDFSEAGFGSLMIDTVSYVGDILSFYLDYQANETFLDTAFEFENIRKIGKQLGYKIKGRPTSFGTATFYATVPAAAVGEGPDSRYYPTVKKGTVLSADSGNRFTLNEDVFFDDPTNEVVVAEVDSTTGLPISYAIKAKGLVLSGELNVQTINVADAERFLKIQLEDPNFSEIVSVIDSDGNEYFEVDSLSQNVVYKAVTNRGRTSLDAKSILKPFVVPRRFTVDFNGDFFFLQFGSGTETELEEASQNLFDPQKVALQMHGRDYVSSTSFDPNRLIKTDKFGIAPGNTTLEIVYRRVDTETANAAVGTLTQVIDPIVTFADETTVDTELAFSVIDSLEVTNEDPITGDVEIPDADELRQRIFDNYASQNRAVTAQDYQAVIYAMPPKFGSVKRAAILRDRNSLKRNLNIYVISEDSEGELVQTSNSIKENLKTWLNRYRMINDTIDILDAKIINLSLEFSILGDLEKNKYDILNDAVTELQNYYNRTFDIGEPFFVTDVYKVLKDVEGVVDVVDVKVKQKTGGEYSRTRIDMERSTSRDGRLIRAPENCIFEIKRPIADIKGIIK